MDWIALASSKTQVDKAGRLLAEAKETAATKTAERAREILSNWRGAHGFPLNTVQMTLRTRARKIWPGSLVAQRLKREASILRKLRRQHAMRLTQMQDIGGCRAVLQTKSQVYRLYDRYRQGRLFSEEREGRDYIEFPARSGYRGIHVIQRYRGSQKEEWNGFVIEVQIRTALQHAWATTVETVDAFLGTDLKASEGPAEWQRLFALVGAAFAFVEKSPHVPETPTDPVALRESIREHALKVDLLRRLQLWRTTVHEAISPRWKDKSYLLLQMRPDLGSMTIAAFAMAEFERATARYAAAERAIAGIPQAQVVLVAADSVRSLRRSYPNYFADTSLFVTQIEKLLHPKAA